MIQGFAVEGSGLRCLLCLKSFQLSRIMSHGYLIEIVN
jgi:hypothetical protein